MVEISVMLALAAMTLGLLWAEDLLGWDSMGIWAFLGTVLTVAARWFVLPYLPEAEGALMADWAAVFRSGSALPGLGGGCPLSLPVQYFLVLCSWVEYPALYIIKYLVFFSETVLAWACLRLVSSFTRAYAPRLAVFLLVLALPSGLILGGCGGMDTSLWCALAVLAAERALADRPWSAAILWGAALCFGWEAVFLLPVVLVLMSRKRMRTYHLLVLPMVFSLLLLPALLAGQTLRETVGLQRLAGITGRAVFQGSPGIYLLGPEPLPYWAGLGCFVLFCAVLVWWLVLCGKRAEDQTLAAAMAFTAAAGAVLLPWMGPDSLYTAEVLCLVIAGVCRWMIPAAALCSGASLLACLRSQFGLTPLPFPFAAGAAVAVMGLLVFYMYRHAYKKSPRSRKK